jgi:3-(3-hydroxy-phenyl)propionate hydroxylase
LELAHKNAFARKLVNSGRLSVPAILADSSLNTPDVDVFGGAMVPGAPLDDGPLEADAWLLRQVGGRFVGLFFADDPRRISEHVTRQFVQLAEGSIPVATLVVANRSGEVRGARVVVDCKGVLARRYDALVGTYYLVRPDQHVAARWREFEVGRVHKALSIATCNA